MDINQVRFGNYTIGTSANSAKKQEKKEQEEKLETQIINENKNPIDSNKMLHIMDAKGAQNRTQINFAAKKEVNTSKYLDENRQNDIIAMMNQFEAGVKEAAAVIDQDFPGLFSEAQKNALAAEAFARQ